jgi:hypothetical protein
MSVGFVEMIALFFDGEFEVVMEKVRNVLDNGLYLKMSGV